MKWSRSMRSIRRNVAFVVVMMVVLAGCSDSGLEDSGGGQVDGGTATVAFSSVVDSLDTAKMSSVMAQGILGHAQEGLLAVDGGGNVQPLLATSWAMSDDGRAWTFELREGVTFHDGTPFNATAVKNNVERWLTPEYDGLLGNLGPVSGANVIDEYTVEITTSSVFSGLPFALAHPEAYMVSPASYKEFGSDLGTAPLAGTGPFVIESFDIAERVEMSRYDDYWGEPAQLESLTFVSAVEDQTRTSMLLTGEADAILYVPLDSIPRIADNPELQLDSVASVRLLGFHLPMTREFADLRFRKALNLAVDRDEIVETLYDGYASVANNSVGPGEFGYKPIEEMPYDPARASELFAEMGWKKGENGILTKDGVEFPTITIAAPNGRYPGDAQVATAVAGYLEQAGIATELYMAEFGSWYETVRAEARDKGWIVLGAWGYPQLDAWALLCQIYTIEDDRNYGGYDNPKLPDSCQAIQAARDLDERRALLEELAASVYEDLPAVYIASPHYVIASRKGLEGVVLAANEVHSFSHAYWAAE